MSFTWRSPAHAFASLFRDAVIVSKRVNTVLGGIQGEEKLVETLTGLVSPGAVIAEQIAFGALGELVAAIHAAGQAAEANGVDVTFDAAVVADVKKLLANSPALIRQVEAVFEIKKAAAA